MEEEHSAILKPGRSARNIIKLYYQSKSGNMMASHTEDFLFLILMIIISGNNNRAILWLLWTNGKDGGCEACFYSFEKCE